MQALMDAPAMQALTEPTIQEKKYFVITNQFGDWKPPFKMISGYLFIQLNVWDHNFFKFCTGQPLKMGKRNVAGQSHYFPFFEELVALRNQLSQKAFEDSIADLEDLNDHEHRQQGKKRRKVHRKARMSDVGLAGEIVRGRMDYDDIEQELVFVFGCMRSELWLHATTTSLAFVQRAMHADFCRGDARQPRTRRGRRAIAAEASDEQSDADQADDAA
jgi:hypothetical protein